MSWLLEEPWTIIGLGAFAELLLAVAFFKTRRGEMLVAMGIVLIVVALAVLLEWLVVTDREAAENTIYAAAEAVQAGDAERLLTYIASEAHQIRSEVRSYMGSVELRSISINALKVRLEPGRPRIAIATFVVRASAKSVELTRTEFLLSMEVTLCKEGDRWLVTAYEWRSPSGNR